MNAHESPKNGDNQEPATEEQALLDQAKETVIQYFKEQFDLEVQITGAKKVPSFVADEIDVEGFVKGHEDQTFNLSVNYNTQETKNFVMSPELKEALEAQDSK